MLGKKLNDNLDDNFNCHENKTNNDPTNLIILSRSKHSKLHDILGKYNKAK